MNIAQRRIYRATLMVAALVTLAFSLLSLSSCGNRFFTATVSGYVRESGDQAGSAGAGINGAEIRVYLKAPTADSQDDYLVKTSTMSSGGQDGYWSHKIMWEAWFPKFPDSGDSGTVYVWVKRPGYFPVIIAASGILSDSTNVLPTIELERIAMSSLKGRVTNHFGQGVDGVRLALDLDYSVEEGADYYATSAQNADGSGYFEFSDIGWIDPDSVPAVDSPSAAQRERANPSLNQRSISPDGLASAAASLYVDDPAWYGAAYRADAPRRLNLVSGSVLDFSASTNPADAFVAYKADFTRKTIEGRVVDSLGNGINGIGLSLDLVSSGEGADYLARTSYLGDKPVGQRDGWYRFTQVAWRDRSPEHPASDAYGDIEEIKIFVDDGDWASAVDVNNPLVVALPSDPEGQTETDFSVPSSILASSASFFVSLVEGQLSSGGSGVNGVRLVLDLGSTAAAEDYVFVTRDIGGQAGRFQFTDIAWLDKSPESPEIEAAALRLPAGDWEALNYGFSLTDGLSLSGGSSLAIPLVRRAVWSYTATLRGRVMLRSATSSGISTQPLAGIPISLSDSGNGALLSSSIPSAGSTVQTDLNGSYSFTVSWTREPSFVPTGPGGGDSFLVDLAIGSDGDAGTTDPAGFIDLSLSSWDSPTQAADRFFVIP